MERESSGGSLGGPHFLQDRPETMGPHTPFLADTHAWGISRLIMGIIPPNFALIRRWFVNGVRYRISIAAIRGRMDGPRSGSGLAKISPWPPPIAGHSVGINGGPLNGPYSRMSIPASFLRPAIRPSPLSLSFSSLYSSPVNSPDVLSSFLFSLCLSSAT